MGFANNKKSLELHKKKGGKIEIKSKFKIKNYADLCLAYTPCVAEISKKIAQNKELAKEYTIKKNTVAVVSDGSAVLGLGNVGAEAAIPVMEGKAAIFKVFADIDAFPICLKTQDPEEIINIIQNIAPVFGGIQLEDIAAPNCFYIENQLQDIGIPVVHDDQHSTAIVVTAALINAAKVIGRKTESLNAVMFGAGAAGTAIAKMLSKELKLKDIIICDSRGIISKNRSDLNSAKKELAEITNKNNRKGTIYEALTSADVFIGVSAGGLLTSDMIKKMNRNPAIFALANPIPEIMPDLAQKAGATIVGTGRSDFPNQINNALSFPGLFRGLLDSDALKLTDKMKMAAALAIANRVKKPTKNKILPSIFDKKLVGAIAESIKSAKN